MILRKRRVSDAIKGAELTGSSVYGALSSVTLLVAASLGMPAYAQDASSPDQIEQIIVTGSSIRGIPPTGSNLIQMGQESIVESGSATMQELFSTVPQLGTFNEAPRPDPHSNGILSTAPNIRGIGQAQTLVLINGQRVVGVGHLQNISDPSIVPPSGVNRVEVIADGASSIYGSDGIAGVVNVLTLREFEGVRGAVRYGWGDGYDLNNLNFVTGTTWNDGGFMMSVESSNTSNLEGFDRDFMTTDFSDRGGVDNRTQNGCIPSQFRFNNESGSATGDYITYGSGAINERCDNSQYTDLYPSQERLSFFGSGHHRFTDRISGVFDIFHSSTDSEANLQPALSNGVMTRDNPFFPSHMVPSDVDSITAYYNVSELTGERLRDVQSVRVWGGSFGTDVEFGRFMWTTYLTGSKSWTDLNEGSFNPGANLAAIRGTTPETALDPFAGRTANDVLVGIADYEQYFGSHQYLWEINSKVDGPLFEVSGGEVRGAVGGVFRKEFYDGENTLSRIGFKENLGKQIGRREVNSVFGELFIPVIGGGNALTGVQNLDISLSARYDKYSDFGNTTNPKIGINWRINDSVMLRGSYGDSFAAPMLPDLFGPDTRAGYGAGGRTPAGVTPQRTGSIFIAGGNPNLDAETANTWSLGMELTPLSMPGLSVSATYYSLAFEGRIYYPNSAFFDVLPEFDQFFMDNIVCETGTYPGGTNCTSLPVDSAAIYEVIKDLRLQNFPRPVNGPEDIPDIYILQDLRRANLAEIDTTGIDLDTRYAWDTSFGSMALQLQGNYITKFDQRAIAGAEAVDQFPFGQQKLKLRSSFSAVSGPATAVLTANFSDKYRDQYLAMTGSGTVQSVETIKSFTSVDFHLGLDLQSLGMGFGSSTLLTLDLSNMFDQDPPRRRAGTGYGRGDVLGRVFTVGIRQEF